jgi:hypothetical protein
MPDNSKVDWKTNGVRVIPGDSLDTNTAQTPGMSRAAAVNFARVGARMLWAGTVTIEPDAKTGASARPVGKRNLCPSWPGPNASGRASGIYRGGHSK